jgi:hypothetical protein
VTPDDADRMPADPFAEPDGHVDPLADGERLYDALAHLAVFGSLGEFASAISALSEAEVRRALTGDLIRLARGVHEQHAESNACRGGRLRRAFRAASEAWRKEWSR